MINKKGFTLMEILAVLLVIAVIASFAVPIVKSVRREMRYQKAKAAAVQLGESVRSFYADSKGCGAFGSFDGKSFTVPSCSGHTVKTGVPGACLGNGVTLVFGCDYISTKMFTDLPYTFEVQDPRLNSDGIFITATENETGVSDPKSFTVNRDMTITENDD